MFPSNLAKKTNFPNMAGIEDCDKYIEKELLEAGIQITSAHENWIKKEVYYRLVINEHIGDYEHHRYIYFNKNEVPYHIKGTLGSFIFERAWYYYRVHGFVPIRIAKQIYNNPIGKRDIRAYGHCGCIKPKGKEVDSYHIDSQEGLNLFVKFIKKIIEEKKNEM